VIAVDESRWPIVAVAKRGRFTVSDATTHLIAFDNVLRRREPFVVAVHYEDAAAAAYDHDPDADGMYRRWLAANAALLAEWCVAVASVAAEAATRERLVRRLAEERAPGGDDLAVFTSDDEAAAWLLGRLREAASHVAA
jgi:hypothetical protein